MTMTMEHRRAERPSLLPEYRAYGMTSIETRAATDGGPIVHFEGIASVVNHGYDLYGGCEEDGGWTEFVDKGAFTKTLSENPLVNFVINHEGMSLARTQKVGAVKPATLVLSENLRGDLAVAADLDTRQGVVADLVIGIERGDLDEMSFKFRVIRDKWLTADGIEVPWWDLAGVERHIVEVSLHKGDVSVVNFGANDATSASLRALEGAMAAVRCGRPLTDEQRTALISRIDPATDTAPVPEPVIKPRGMSAQLARGIAGL
jgi:HK97 family phage prohead protease